LQIIQIARKELIKELIADKQTANQKKKELPYTGRSKHRYTAVFFTLCR
jgi:hypothetical protein